MNTNNNEGNQNMAIDFTDLTKPEPVAAPTAPEPVRSANDGWSGPGVSASAKARCQADEKAAAEAGFTLRPPVYEIGRLVNYVGVENFKASRQEFEDMATANEACSNLIQQVQAEDRKDLVVALPDLGMLDDGRLNRGKGNLPMSERALTGLCGFATPGGGSYLRDCPPELRAHNLNHWFEKGYREDKRTYQAAIRAWEKECILAARVGGTAPPMPEMTMIPREVTLRTRMNHSEGRRENFAVVGPKYGAHDIDKIAQQVLEAMPGDARADITYDGYQARINVLFHSNVLAEQAAAGEIFKAGIILKTADDGSGSIKISAEVWRNLCLNLYIIDHDRELITRRRHVGDSEAIRLDVQAGIEAAMQKVGYFADKWSEAKAENVLDKYGVAGVEDVFRGLVHNKVVHVPNTRPEEMFARLNRAWQAEPGHNTTDIVNAVTRAAHTEEWSKWTDVEDMERVGGELLFAPKWDIVLPEKAVLTY